MSADARTVAFLELLRGTAHRCGLDPDALAVTEAAALAEHLTFAARKAWRAYDWPDAVKLEARSFRPQFELDVTYALGTEVYDLGTNRYYRAVQDGFAGRPLEDGAYWERDRHVVKSMAFLAPGNTPICELLGAWNRNPATNGPGPHGHGEGACWDLKPERNDAGPWPLGFYLTETGAQFDPHAPNVVWLRFRVPPPRFTVGAWSAATQYGSGDLVYVAPDCFLALEDCLGTPQGPGSAPARWRVQNLPELLEDAVKRWAKAEWLSGEGEDQKALSVATAAQDDLDEATATISDQQGQTRRYGVVTRTTAGGLFRPRRLVH